MTSEKDMNASPRAHHYRAYASMPTLKDIPRRFSEQVLEHPFLARCSDGTIRFDELRGFLVQHGKYGAYFTRYLCALMSQLESGDDVMSLCRNLLDELGYGSDTSLPHSLIYARMLRELGIDIDNQPIYPETQNLIDTMFMLCRQPGGLAGLGALCLGAEAIVPSLYARILEGFRRNAVPEQHLNFFAIHLECDDGHSETMLSIIDRIIAESPSRRPTILAAGQTAILARLSFFDALLKDNP
jgi:pyrroloquinoline-quinone synthase